MYFNLYVQHPLPSSYTIRDTVVCCWYIWAALFTHPLPHVLEQNTYFGGGGINPSKFEVKNISEMYFNYNNTFPHHPILFVIPLCAAGTYG